MASHPLGHTRRKRRVVKLINFISLKFSHGSGASRYRGKEGSGGTGSSREKWVKGPLFAASDLASRARILDRISPARNPLRRISRTNPGSERTKSSLMARGKSWRVRIFWHLIKLDHFWVKMIKNDHFWPQNRLYTKRF